MRVFFGVFKFLCGCVMRFVVGDKSFKDVVYVGDIEIFFLWLDLKDRCVEV